MVRRIGRKRGGRARWAAPATRRSSSDASPKMDAGGPPPAGAAAGDEWSGYDVQWSFADKRTAVLSQHNKAAGGRKRPGAERAPPAGACSQASRQAQTTEAA